MAAKVVLSELSLNDLFNNPVVDYDEDEVTRIIDQVNMRILKVLNIGQLQNYANLSYLRKQPILISNEFPWTHF